MWIDIATECDIRAYQQPLLQAPRIYQLIARAFNPPVNNLLKAVGSYASRGYFDPGGNDDEDGYPSRPVNWGLNTGRKRSFLGPLKQMTGA